MSRPRLGEPIARGRTAEIYAWGEGQILKLFHDWFDEAAIDYESRLARAVHRTGLPVPAVGEIIEFEGRRGLIYERVDGPTMLAQLVSRPWRLAGSARCLAQLHAEMHSCDIEADLPAQHRRLEDKIGQAPILSHALREQRLGELATLPAGQRLCHGDFHPGNVILAGGGPVVIDWIDVTLGNPLADVARTSVLFLGARAGPGPSPLPKLMLSLYHRLYLRYYFRLRPGGQGEYRAWYPIVAAARLDEGIAELETWLLAQARDGLG
ncbi:MAG: phosphotransferase [Anaerolineae bacterium]|jgi:aminoglycoside phosphotransferase (APT) family kinase protein